MTQERRAVATTMPKTASQIGKGNFIQAETIVATPVAVAAEFRRCGAGCQANIANSFKA